MCCVLDGASKRSLISCCHVLLMDVLDTCMYGSLLISFCVCVQQKSFLFLSQGVVSELCFDTNELVLETGMARDLSSAFRDRLSAWWLVVGALAARQTVRSHGLAVAEKPVSARAGSNQNLLLFVGNSFSKISENFHQFSRLSTLKLFLCNSH